MSAVYQPSRLKESFKQLSILRSIGSLFNSTMPFHGSKRATFSQINVENGLHQAVALSAMTLLVTAHRAIMNTGFTLRRRGLSTDAVVSLTVGLVTFIWTMLVVLSGLFIGQCPCRNDLEDCLTRLAYAPWMMQCFSFFWALAFVHEVLSIRARERNLKAKLGKDEESTTPRTAMSTIDRLLCSNHLRIWRMNSSRGSLDWSGSVDWRFRWAMYSTMITIVSVTTYGAIRTRLYTIGMLNLVGLVLFILGAGGANKYAAAPHMYTADMLRVVLETRHKEGTVYILPSRDHGFDAVWSPKIDYEHREIDDGSILSASPQETRQIKKGEVKSLDLRLAAFNTVSDITSRELNCLATWLYAPESAPQAMRKIACLRVPSIHLVSTNIMISLWHAEYLVFMHRHLLEPNLAQRVGLLRGLKTTGMHILGTETQIGRRPGLEGYEEAVRYVYSLFNEPIDSSAIRPTSAAPKTSEILPICPDTIERYVAELWDHCIESQETTFAALYAFCWFWTADIGNDVANGWHGFPLRSRDREGDLVSWHVIWRQGWYSVVIAQLTSMSPIILSAFVAGILQ